MHGMLSDHWTKTRSDLRARISPRYVLIQMGKQDPKSGKNLLVFSLDVTELWILCMLPENEINKSSTACIMFSHC